MRISLVLCLLLSLTSEARDRCRIDRNSRNAECLGLPTFSFATNSQTGMGTACACAAVTGVKGEAMTFTRASTGWCFKGNETSLIVNGDLVECSNNLPRIMPGGDGLGKLGVNLWAARTTSNLRDVEIDNAAWTKTGTVVAAPTVTANFATGPDNTTSAERVQFAACANVGEASVVTQDYVGTAATWVSSIFLKGNGTSGSISLYLFDTTTAAGNAVACSFTSATWTRCVSLSRVMANTTHRVGFGCSNLAVITGDGSTGAADVLVWMAEAQAGVNVGPPITTAAAAATRVIEDATFARPAASPAFEAVGSAAATFVQTYISGANGSLVVFDNLGRPLQIQTSGAQFGIFDSTNNPAVNVTLTANTEFRTWSTWTGTTAVIANVNALTSTTGTFDGTMPVNATFAIGSVLGAGMLNGTIKNICLDVSTTRCR